MIVVSAHIADIHFNPNNYIQLSEELEECYLNRLRNMNVLNCIFLHGDLCDYILSFNSKASNTVIDFMEELVNIAIAKSAKIRIIRGTFFHDNNQLRNFLRYENRKDVDFKLIETVYEEELFPDFNVLYIPEEYVEDVQEYYGKYFNEEKTYNMVIGHGMFQEVGFMGHKQETAVTMKNSPIFNRFMFEKICIGPVLFGHVHSPMTIGGFIYYIRSFSRLGYGEEEDKGYIVSLYDTEEKSYYIKFEHNYLAKEYKTIEYDNIEKYDVKELIKEIESQLKDYLRVKINNRFNEIELNNIEILRNYFSRNKNINILIKNIDKKGEKEMEETIILKDKFSYLFDNGVPLPTKISKFIQMTRDVYIPDENIEKILM